MGAVADRRVKGVLVPAWKRVVCACVDGGRWGENEHPPGGALLCAQEFCRDGASRRATSPSLQVGRRRRRPARSAAKGGRRQAANAGYWGAGTRCHTVPYRLVWAPAVSSPRTRRGWKGMEVTPHTHHEPEGLRAPPETAHASRSAAFVEGRCVSVMIPLCCKRREDQGEEGGGCHVVCLFALLASRCVGPRW